MIPGRMYRTSEGQDWGLLSFLFSFSRRGAIPQVTPHIPLYTVAAASPPAPA